MTDGKVVGVNLPTPIHKASKFDVGRFDNGRRANAIIPIAQAREMVRRTGKGQANCLWQNRPFVNVNLS